MINHFNFQKFNDKVLITNDLGKYAFLTAGEFKNFIMDKLDENNECYSILKDRYFLIPDDFSSFAEETVPILRSLKQYVFTATALHIFAITNMCNMRCVYCQANTTLSHYNGLMSKETGIKAIDLAMQSPAKCMTFEFQGGEPLLNFDVFKSMIERAEELNSRYKKDLQFTIVTNLIALDEEKLEYMMNHNISICTSLDGNKIVHDKNRPLFGGGASFTYVISNINRIRSKGIEIGAIETTTRYSLQNAKEIVDTYIENGINSIFVRPLSPLGFAKENWNEIGYTPERYLAFYKEILEYIIYVNQNGIYFPEATATFFLKKILSSSSDNYMELRSPCGASIGQLSYYYNGDVFTCDEGRMIFESGDSAFRLGNVYENTYDDLINAPACKAVCAASVIETLPDCCECVYHPFCGVCPAVIYAMNNDLFSNIPNSYRCKINKGILDLLFDYLLKNDNKIIDVFFSWIEN